MGRIKAAWEALEKQYSNRVGLAISFFVALVLLAGFIWGVCWSRAQDKKADERERVQDKKADERALTQKEQIKLLVSEQEKHINRLVSEQEKHINRLVSEQDQNIIQLEQSHKANTKKLTEEYAKIVSGEISDLKEEMKRFVERNGEMLSDEMVRKILASHASDKNVEQAREDAYKKALDEGVEGYYIFEINQAAGGFGHGVFMTDSTWWRGDPVKGSSSLLTEEEKDYIDPLLDSYFKEEKSGKRKDGFADPNTQQEIFFFLLAESGIGRITEPPKRQISYWASYREQKIEVLSPYAKLGAVIGHIGDKMRSYE